jgi:tripartite-type tricarboxylate transporter receptor subunit TctC
MTGLNRIATAAATVLALAAGGAAAQDYPGSRAINLLVGFSAGGNVDVLARTVAPFLEKHLGGASIAVINRPGAAGSIMNQELANATPDGYTLGLLSGPGFLTVLFGNDLEYDADSFTYLGTFADEAYGLVVGNHTPWETLDELVEAARADPGGITIGGAGLGSAPHLALKVFERAAGIQFNFIPGPGAAEMRNQVMGGHIDGGVTTVSVGIPMQEEGQGRLLTVFAQDEAGSGGFPVATEQGYDAVWSAMRGLAGPHGLPEDIAAKLAEAVRATMDDQEFLAEARERNITYYYVDGAAFRDVARRQQALLEEIWAEQPWIE